MAGYIHYQSIGMIQIFTLSHHKALDQGYLPSKVMHLITTCTVLCNVLLPEQLATGLEQPVTEQSTVYTMTQLQEELDDTLLV